MWTALAVVAVLLVLGYAFLLLYPPTSAAARRVGLPFLALLLGALAGGGLVSSRRRTRQGRRRSEPSSVARAQEWALKQTADAHEELLAKRADSAVELARWRERRQKAEAIRDDVERRRAIEAIVWGRDVP